MYEYASRNNVKYSDIYRDIYSDMINVTINLTGTDLKVFSILKETPNATREEIASRLQVTVRTVQRCLDKLSKAGMINRIGSRKTGYWEVRK